MCEECGCGLSGETSYDGVAETILKSRQTSVPNPSGPVSGHAHEEHDLGHEASNIHSHVEGGESAPRHQIVSIQKSILEKNDRLAEQNRGYFRAKKMLVLNVLSAPGSGKTTLIQKTAEALGKRLRVGVIVGDLATENDASRLRAAGIPVVQITTGTVCHLEAEMVARAMSKLDLDALDVLVIENVGTLVCPASYDLGEHLRVVLLSVTEGEDKPLKYPPMFHSANVAVLTKCDLAVAAGFDRQQALDNLRRVSHHARVFEVSARAGQGMEDWCAFLLQQRNSLKN